MSAQNYGHKVIPATITTDGSVSTAINVGGYNHVSLEIPTFALGLASSNCSIQILAAKGDTDTFRPVYDMGVYSAGSGLLAWQVPSSVGGYNVVCDPASRFNYIKIQIMLNTAETCYQSKVHVHN